MLNTQKTELKNYEQLPGRDICCGCNACVQICPKGVLKQGSDKEGFVNPVIDDRDKCINCSLCIQVCQLKQSTQLKPNIAQKGFIAQGLDRIAVKRSSSGGAFFEFAKFFLETTNGVVYGASFCADKKVRHICVHSIDELKKLQGSKYVQSSINNAYSEIKSFLNKDVPVLFSGTPCQVAGLRTFLRRDYQKLITIDIICHGVTSPKLLSDYITKVEKHEHRECINIRFRWKHPYIKSGSSFYMMMMMNKGLDVIRDGKKDPYLNVYLNGYAFRESCYQCSYANLNRVGDITIGDCDSHQHYSNFFPELSNSTIILNTEKALRYWEKCKYILFVSDPLDIQLEAQCNKQLRSPFPRPALRDSIYSKWSSATYQDMFRQFGELQNWRQYLKLRIAMNVPMKWKQIIHSILHDK